MGKFLDNQRLPIILPIKAQGPTIRPAVAPEFMARGRQRSQEQPPKHDPRKSPRDDEAILLAELRNAGPRKPPKRAPRQ